MMYLAVFLVLFVLELVYFKIADRYNIIDKPNHRSAHTEITLRGGGVIFPIAFLLYAASYFFRENSILSPQNYLIFGIGLISFCSLSESSAPSSQTFSSAQSGLKAIISL